jgi:hypothetical protein
MLHEVPCCILRCLSLHVALIVASHVAVSFLLYVLLCLGDTSSSRSENVFRPKGAVFLAFSWPSRRLSHLMIVCNALSFKDVPGDPRQRAWCGSENATLAARQDLDFHLQFNFVSPSLQALRDSWSYCHWLRYYTYKTFLGRCMEFQNIHW